MERLPVEERQDWRWWVTPKPLAGKPIHRWYIFPHSFASELVHALIDEWGLTSRDHILDPFAGAGTTLLAAKEKGIPATGYDLSPLAVLAARVKITNYKATRLEDLWSRLRHAIQPARWKPRRTRVVKSVGKYTVKPGSERVMEGNSEKAGSPVETRSYVIVQGLLDNPRIGLGNRCSILLSYGGVVVTILEGRDEVQ